MRRNRNIAVVATLLLPILAPAATLWWDSNGAAAGASVTPSGTWGISPFWSTSSTGVLATANTLTTALDTLIFSAGSDAVGSPLVTVNGVQSAQLLSIEEGAVTFSGGTIALGGATKTSPVGGITVAAGAGNPTVSSSLSIAGAQTFNVGAGRTLALSAPGNFTRAVGASLNVRGAGSVTATMTNLAENQGATGIVGPWASFGADASTQYATFSGSTITGLTGTPAATPAEITDTTGLVNYDLAVALGALPATVSANTIRFTGSANQTTTLGATSFTVNGLMNAGTDQWMIASNRITIGSDRELVVNAANHRIEIRSLIQDNPGGASALTVTGKSNVFLSAANTYTGATTISSGKLIIGITSPTGSLSPRSAIVNHGDFAFKRTNVITQGIEFADVISGSGLLENDAGSIFGITIFNGTNTYTGPTNIGAGTLSVATIGNGGVPGNLGAASSEAANLLFFGTGNGALQYTGTTASTDRNFIAGNGRVAIFEVTNSGTPNLHRW